MAMSKFSEHLRRIDAKGCSGLTSVSFVTQIFTFYLGREELLSCVATANNLSFSIFVMDQGYLSKNTFRGRGNSIYIDLKGGDFGIPLRSSYLITNERMTLKALMKFLNKSIGAKTFFGGSDST